MEKHIIALLKQNLRVIIPEFGAFIVRQKEPEIIVFNEFLRYNDGLLIDYITKAEQLDKEIAEQQVSDFAQECSKLLESGQTLEIKGLGSLTRDASGKIHFTTEEAGSASKGRAGKTTTKATKEELQQELKDTTSSDKKAEMPSAQKRADAAKPEPAEKRKTAESPDKDEAPSGEKEQVGNVAGKAGKAGKKEGVPEKDGGNGKSSVSGAGKEQALSIPVPQADKSKAAGAQKAEPIASPDVDKSKAAGAQKAEPIASPDVDKSKAAGAQKAEPIPASVADKSKAAVTSEREAIPAPSARKNSTVNQILIWIGVFLFANIIVFAWFLYRDQIRGFLGREGNEVMVADTLLPFTDAEPMFDQVAEDTLPVTQAEEPAVRETPVALGVATSQQQYYIVAGCFREESNADALVQSLRNQGYDAEKFGNIGNLHAVSYAAFNSQAEALKELERIRQEEQPEAWMTRF